MNNKMNSVPLVAKMCFMSKYDIEHTRSPIECRKVAWQE